jgi:two-component system cell cycle sensor histidine kinase/response regulator CckA
MPYEAPIKVLIVDDDEEIRLFMKIRLKRDAQHLSLATVEGGKECLDYMKGGRVDCILSDYQMPRMNGMELLKKLREGGDDVPFIFVTGQGNEEVAREAFINGAQDYFTKDIGFAHFARIVNSVEQAVRHREAERDRIKSEQALRESEARFRGLVEESLVGVYLIQDGRFVYANPRLAEIFGYTREEILGLDSLMDTVAQSDRPLVEANINKRIEGEVECIKYRFGGVRKDGSTVNVEVLGSKTIYQGRPALIGTLLDVTWRKAS